MSEIRLLLAVASPASRRPLPEREQVALADIGQDQVLLVRDPDLADG